MIYSDQTLVIIDWSPDVTGSVNPQPHITTIKKDLLLPVNCVLDGQQREPLSKLMGLDGAITGPMRGIFKE